MERKHCRSALAAKGIVNSDGQFEAKHFGAAAIEANANRLALFELETVFVKLL
jgi:hypothetical protein